MPILTRDQLFAYKHPEPLDEIYPLPELGGEVHIVGVTKKAERDAIHTDAKGLKKTAAGLKVALGLNFVPDEDDLTAAAWAAACVIEPKMESTDWLRFANEGYSVLGAIWLRAMVCSRILSDTDPHDPQAEPIPDGVAAGKAELLEALNTDPLVSGGGCTATDATESPKS